jgi:hypothetical protein
MGVSPLRVAGNKVGANKKLEDFVTVRVMKIQNDYVIETARMLNRPEIRDMLAAGDAEAALAEIDAGLRGMAAKIARGKFPGEFKAAYTEAALGGLAEDEKIYRAAADMGLLTKTPPYLQRSAGVMNAVARGYKTVWDKLSDVTVKWPRYEIIARLKSGVKRWAITEEIALKPIRADVGLGLQSVDKGIRVMLDSLTRQGAVEYAYPISGAKISMAAYARREVVTGVHNLATELSFQRARDWEADLIQLSAHAGARPGCSPYQGNVYSISGKHPKYKPFDDTSYGEPSGILGINCRHHFWPFFEGLNDEYTAEQKNPALLLRDKNGEGPGNYEIYEATQRQRHNERQIRGWKLRAEASEAAGQPNPLAERKVREWQARQRSFLKRCQDENIDLRRDYLREKI